MIFLSGFGNSKDAVAYLKKLVPSQHPFALHALGDIQAYLIYVHEVEIVDAVAARTRIGIATAVLRHRRPALIDNNLFVRCHTLATVIASWVSYRLSTPLESQLHNRKSKTRPAFDGRSSNRGCTSSGPGHFPFCRGLPPASDRSRMRLESIRFRGDSTFFKSAPRFLLPA